MPTNLEFLRYSERWTLSIEMQMSNSLLTISSMAFPLQSSLGKRFTYVKE